MFSTGSFEEDIAKGMEQKLVARQTDNQFSFDRIAKAVDFLNAAAQIFDDTGFHSQAEVITSVLEGIAKNGLKKKAEKRHSMHDLTHDEIKFYKSLPAYTKESLNKLINRIDPQKIDADEFVRELKILHQIKKPEMLEFESLSPNAEPGSETIEFKSLAPQLDKEISGAEAFEVSDKKKV